MIDFDKLILAPCQRVFGQPVLFKPKSGGIFQVSGIFKSEYEPVAVTEQGVVQGQRQVLGVRRHLMPQPVHNGDLFTITDKSGIGRDYEVADMQPDSSGDLRLFLMSVD